MTAFGAAVVLVGFGLAMTKLTARKAVVFACALPALGGLLLLAFPQADQPWLDALEDMAPAVQTAFLTPAERSTRNETLESVERARAEFVRLRALEQDVRWGKVEMEPDKVERLRQYIAGRSEIAAGDQLVLRDLRRKARQRQRLGLGLPLILLGAASLYVIARPLPKGLK